MDYQIALMFALSSKGFSTVAALYEPVYKQRPMNVIHPEMAMKGDIVFYELPHHCAEGVIVDVGMMCEGLFPGIHWIDLGRDASHIISFAVAADLVGKGQLRITRDGSIWETE